MISPMLGVWAWLIVTPAPVETRFAQLAPERGETPRRSAGVGRAVVLLHGLRPQPVSAEAARRAEPSYWELPQAPVVSALQRDADVYAFHYAQNAAVDDIARTPALARAVEALRQAGYLEVVLIGYSAGALIARQFVEDAPDGGGVTKVIQVCPPNGGSDWTRLSPGVRSVQLAFLRSLTKEARAAALAARADRRIPSQVEFVCVVAVANWTGDGVVRRDAQWTPELRAQGIPAETIFLQHVGAMYSSRLAARLAELARTPQPRWTSEQVSAARYKVLGILGYLER
jgi:pimeloyl-ACP methyl ester carboxylesterase